MTDEAVILGVPTDFGTNRRGVDMGPSAIRYADLHAQIEAAGVNCDDRGDIEVDASVHSPTRSRPPSLETDEDAFDRIRSVCEHLSSRVNSVVRSGAVPVVLGGDHSISIGTMRGLVAEYDLGVVWLDAHGDYNTPETSPSGNVHGMSLAAALGEGSFSDTEWPRAPGLRPENIAIVGVRDLDDGESVLLRESGITVFPMPEIDSDGIRRVCERVIDVVSAGTDGVLVSLDLDFLDPLEAPGVGTPVKGGVTYREAHLVMETLATEITAHGRLGALELVEVNPIRDRENGTAELATELAASALGKRII